MVGAAPLSTPPRAKGGHCSSLPFRAPDRHTLKTLDRGKQDKEDFRAFLLVGWRLRNASATLSKHIQKLLMSPYAAQTHCVLLSFFTVSINPPKAAA